MVSQTAPMTGKAPHPAVYMVMVLPFGIAGGYYSVTLGYLLSHNGVSTASIAVLISILTWMQVAKILWAPMVDSAFTYRGIYFVACLVVAVTLAGMGLVPSTAANMPLLSVLAVVLSAAFGLLGITTNGLMARVALPGQRGRAGGWSQVGNLGGSAAGGGLGLWIATHSSLPWLSGVVLGAICACSVLVLPFVPEPEHAHRAPRLSVTLKNIAVEVWGLARARTGALALLIMLLPMCTGSAGNLFSAVANDWHASGDLVALVNGVVGGLAAGVGCLIGGYACDRIEGKTGYLLSGLLMALSTALMIAVPKTPTSFVILTLAYQVIAGMSYAACYAVVLSASASQAAASKCDMLIAVANIPIAAMTTLDGAAQTRFGTDGMLLTETVAGVLAVGFYIAVAAGTKRHRPALA
jgi:PAT family beta-lactamase induction signal transducer AmpG